MMAEDSHQESIPVGENGWPRYTHKKPVQDKEPEPTRTREQPATRQQQQPVMMNYPQAIPHQPIPAMNPAIIQQAILAQRVHAPIKKAEWKGFQKTVAMLTPTALKSWKLRRRH